MGIAPHGSHRSGRAQLRHPVRLVAGLRALCYLPALCVQHPGLGVPDLSPTVKSATRRPLHSAGSPTHRFPYPLRYYGALRFPADHFAALRWYFAWRYHPAPPVFAPLRPVGGGLGPGTFGFGCPSAPYNVGVEPQGVPSSWGTLMCLCRVLRPRRDRFRQAIAAGRRGPRDCGSRGLSRVLLSRLNSTALALAVYASPSPLRCRRRKTRFRLPARLCRVGLATHRAPTKGF